MVRDVGMTLAVTGFKLHAGISRCIQSRVHRLMLFLEKYHGNQQEISRPSCEGLRFQRG